jgi:hypothetical protein
MVASLLALLALAAPLALSLIRNGDTTGPILVLGHLADLGAALSILSISAAIGVALLRRFPGGIGSSLELLPFSVALGAGVLAPGILAAVALAGVRRWVLGALLTGLVIVLRCPLREVAAHLRPALADLLGRPTAAARGSCSWGAESWQHFCSAWRSPRQATGIP